MLINMNIVYVFGLVLSVAVLGIASPAVQCKGKIFINLLASVFYH